MAGDGQGSRRAAERESDGDSEPPTLLSGGPGVLTIAISGTAGGPRRVYLNRDVSRLLDARDAFGPAEAEREAPG